MDDGSPSFRESENKRWDDVIVTSTHARRTTVDSATPRASSRLKLPKHKHQTHIRRAPARLLTFFVSLMLLQQTRKRKRAISNLLLLLLSIIGIHLHLQYIGVHSTVLFRHFHVHPFSIPQEVKKKK
jgi:hypothetical protein